MEKRNKADWFQEKDLKSTMGNLTSTLGNINYGSWLNKENKVQLHKWNPIKICFDGKHTKSLWSLTENQIHLSCKIFPTEKSNRKDPLFQTSIDIECTKCLRFLR